MYGDIHDHKYQQDPKSAAHEVIASEKLPRHTFERCAARAPTLTFRRAIGVALVSHGRFGAHVIAPGFQVPRRIFFEDVAVVPEARTSVGAVLLCGARGDDGREGEDY